MARLSPVFQQQLFDNNGAPLAGGKLYAYEAGTSTPKDTFTTEEGDVANTNPVILDSAGRANVWLGSGAYKIVLKDSTEATTFWTIDNVTGETTNAFSSTVIDIASNTNITTVYNNNTLRCTASLTLSLLGVADADDGFYFQVRNDSAGNVTIDPDGSETINGASTLTIPAGQSCVIVCNGVAWYSLFLKGTIATADIGDNQVTLAKIQEISTATLLGRATGGTGDVEVLSATTAGAVLTGGGVAREQDVNTWSAQQSIPVTTLTDGANISWNLNNGNTAQVTLGGNRTLDNPTNMVNGGTYILKVTQDGTGSRTLSYGANYLWANGGTAPTLSTAAGAVDILTFYSDGTNMYGVAQLDFS